MSRAGSLRGYVLIRIALMIPMIWVLLTVVFLMMRVAPGDPISATLGGKLSPAELAARQAALGFDRPLLVQYLDYLWDAVRFQFGTTITDGQTIGSIIVENGGATLTLTRRGADLRADHRPPARPDRRPLPRDGAGRVHPHLRDPRLRRAAVLRRPAGAAAVRQEPRLAAGLEDGVADRAGHGGRAHAHPDRRPRDRGQLERGVGRLPASDPARGDARAAGHRRVHPPRAGQRRAGARRRLRRGRARPRRARAARRLAPRVPQRARSRSSP